MAKARIMVDFPLAEVSRDTTTEMDANCRTVSVQRQVIKPVGWSLRDAARLAEVADHLARVAAEMDTDRRVLDVNFIYAEAERIARQVGKDPDEVIEKIERLAEERWLRGEREDGLG